MPRITEIRLYPIKSCGGISVETATLEARGFAGDRRYMLVDEGGRFLTQREHPEMALIKVRRAAASWAVDAPGQETLELPMSLAIEREQPAVVWGDSLSLALAEPPVNEWFSDALAMSCRLVHMGEGHLRAVKRGRGRQGDVVSLADGAPVLLTTEASLGALNARLRRPIRMDRFRPNLVTTARHPFAEDGWKRISAGEAELEVGWACSRCVVPTIDPETGQRDAGEEPIRTLKGFRRGPEGVMFGQNLIPRRLGALSVGDSIEVVGE